MSSNDNRAFTSSRSPSRSSRRSTRRATRRARSSSSRSSSASPTRCRRSRVRLRDVLPLGRLTGLPARAPPICSSAPPNARASCPAPAYRVTRARGADTLSGRADKTGTLVVGPFRGAPPLTGGDVLTLSNGRRALTTLHVAHLVAVIDGEETVLGPGSRCQPGLYYGAPPSRRPVQLGRRADGPERRDADRPDLPAERVGEGPLGRGDRADRRPQRRSHRDRGGRHREHLPDRRRDALRAVHRAGAGGLPRPRRRGHPERLPRCADDRHGERPQAGDAGSTTSTPRRARRSRA